MNSAHIEPYSIFLSVSEKTLSEDDMLVILNEVSTACPKWYYIGLQLNVPPHILDGIKSEPTSVHPDKVIRYWLTHRNPRPTWRALANALRKPTVGESRLAENVERKCCNRKARAVDEINGCKDAGERKKVSLKPEPHLYMTTLGLMADYYFKNNT